MATWIWKCFFKIKLKLKKKLNLLLTFIKITLLY